MSQEPTPADVILQVEALTVGMRDLQVSLSALQAKLATVEAAGREDRARLAAAEARLPPPGWEVGNYIRSSRPSDCLVCDTSKGGWSIWRSPVPTCGGPLAEGATKEDAIRALGDR